MALFSKGKPKDAEPVAFNQCFTAGKPQTTIMTVRATKGERAQINFPELKCSAEPRTGSFGSPGKRQTLRGRQKRSSNSKQRIDPIPARISGRVGPRRLAVNAWIIAKDRPHPSVAGRISPTRLYPVINRTR